jgi:excisionase family DNA binding protein
MITAEKVFDDLVSMPIKEREKLFSMIARTGFDKAAYTHNDVFGDLNDYPFTVKETASYLEISEITVRRWIKGGVLKPSGKLGRSWVFDADYLSEFKQSRSS